MKSSVEPSSSSALAGSTTTLTLAERADDVVVGDLGVEVHVVVEARAAARLHRDAQRQELVGARPPR